MATASRSPGRSPAATATTSLELLDRVPSVRGRVGRPRRRPRTLIADRGYDHDKYRRLLWKRGIKPVIGPPRDRARLRARPPPLGRRAHLRLAAQPPPPADPHRPPRRHPRRLPRTRLLPHLLATAGDVIELGPLSATRSAARPSSKSSDMIGRPIHITPAAPF